LKYFQPASRACGLMSALHAGCRRTLWLQRLIPRSF
jgi:hypothetical protein